ncbi:TPA: hypothetical protein MEA72_004563 [Klebsiella aerogenes]|nr:hypothetical protein [Klebsiella aerogenes]
MKTYTTQRLCLKYPNLTTMVASRALVLIAPHCSRRAPYLALLFSLSFFPPASAQNGCDFSPVLGSGCFAGAATSSNFSLTSARIDTWAPEIDDYATNGLHIEVTLNDSQTQWFDLGEDTGSCTMDRVNALLSSKMPLTTNVGTRPVHKVHLLINCVYGNDGRPDTGRGYSVIAEMAAPATSCSSSLEPASLSWQLGPSTTGEQKSTTVHVTCTAPVAVDMTVNGSDAVSGAVPFSGHSGVSGTWRWASRPTSTPASSFDALLNVTPSSNAADAGTYTSAPIITVTYP